MTPLVLLHGWGVRPCVFDALSAKLARHHEVHTPALPGYEDAPMCRPYDLATIAARIAAAVPERCFVAGWSLGGQVALAWAQSAPRQVERIALIATSPCFVQRESWTSAMEPRVLADFAAALELDARRTLSRFSLLQAQGDSLERAVVLGLRGALAGPPSTQIEALRDGLDILRDADLRASLRAIAQPALVVHGENDALVPRAAARYLSATLPGGVLAEVANAAHAPFVSQPHTVAYALQEFFA